MIADEHRGGLHAADNERAGIRDLDCHYQFLSRFHFEWCVLEVQANTTQPSRRQRIALQSAAYFEGIDSSMRGHCPQVSRGRKLAVGRSPLQASAHVARLSKPQQHVGEM